MKWLLRILLTLFFLNSNCINSFAADFITNVDSTIDAQIPSQTTVTHNITITNADSYKYLKTATYYLESTEPRHIQVTSNSKISTSVTGSAVTITFLTPHIGKGQTHHVSITYNTSNLVLHEGEYTLADIPLFKAADVASRSATLMLPGVHKNVDYSSIDPDSIIPNDKYTEIKYSNITQPSLLVRQAKNRTVRTTLKFQLVNSNMSPIETQVALPPDTDFQQTTITTIDPLPLTVTTDQDQNRIATFHLEPKETKNVTVTEEITVYAEPYTTQPHLHDINTAYWSVRTTHDTKIPKLSIPINSKEILQTFPELTQPNSFSSTKRVSPQNCLTNRTESSYADCIDAIISLLHLQSIPARRHIGIPITYGSNYPLIGDIAKTHVWLEYFDKNQNHWITFDPAVDLHHADSQFHSHSLNYLTLLINGANDAMPVSALQYTNADQPTIQLMTVPPSIQTLQLSAVIEPAHKYFQTNKYQLNIVNNSYTALYNSDIQVISNTAHIETVHIDRLTPNGQSIIPISKSITQFPIHLVSNNIRFKISYVKSPYTTTVIIAAILVITASCLTVFTGRLLVSRRR